MTNLVVFVIVLVVTPFDNIEEDHWENQENEEDTAGVDVDGDNCKSSQSSWNYETYETRIC